MKYRWNYASNGSYVPKNIMKLEKGKNGKNTGLVVYNRRVNFRLQCSLGGSRTSGRKDLMIFVLVDSNYLM